MRENSQKGTPPKQKLNASTASATIATPSGNAWTTHAMEQRFQYERISMHTAARPFVIFSQRLSLQNAFNRSRPTNSSFGVGFKKIDAKDMEIDRIHSFFLPSRNEVESFRKRFHPKRVNEFWDSNWEVGLLSSGFWSVFPNFSKPWSPLLYNHFGSLFWGEKGGVCFVKSFGIKQRKKVIIRKWVWGKIDKTLLRHKISKNSHRR